jgi:hypothetical protein
LTGFTDHSDFEAYRTDLHNATIDQLESIDIKAAIERPKPYADLSAATSERAGEIVPKYRGVKEPSVPYVH